MIAGAAMMAPLSASLAAQDTTPAATQIAAPSESKAVAVKTGNKTKAVKTNKKKKAASKKQVKKRSAKASTTSKASTKKKARKKVIRRAAIPERPSTGRALGLHSLRDKLNLKSSVALVIDQETNEVLFEKNTHAVLPIASLTKLMTAMVVVEAQQPLDEILEVSDEDVDREKFTSSRLRLGAELSRRDMLLLALMSSENRAASALGRHYPGGRPAFITAMNAKAKSLGMNDTRYGDSTGLSTQNVSSAVDLSKLVKAAYAHPLIREFSTHTEHTVMIGRRPLQFHSSNRLVGGNNSWQIGLQKTGYTSEAGRCLVMQATVKDRPVVMIFLDSVGKLSRFADANRVRTWLEALQSPSVSAALAATGGGN